MSRRARSGLVAAGLVAAAGVLAHVEPPSDAVDDGVASTPAWLDCAACHAEIDAAWRDSLHAAAWTDPIVQAEFARSPGPSCRGCHAPASVAAPDDSDAAARGIDCVACHLRDGWILAAWPSPAGVLAHPVRAAPAQATVDACRDCHQFDFADGNGDGHADVVLQSVELRGEEAFAVNDELWSDDIAEDSPLSTQLVPYDPVADAWPGVPARR